MCMGGNSNAGLWGAVAQYAAKPGSTGALEVQRRQLAEQNRARASSQYHAFGRRAYRDRRTPYAGEPKRPLTLIGG